MLVEHTLGVEVHGQIHISNWLGEMQPLVFNFIFQVLRCCFVNQPPLQALLSEYHILQTVADNLHYPFQQVLYLRYFFIHIFIFIINHCSLFHCKILEFLIVQRSLFLNQLRNVQFVPVR